MAKKFVVETRFNAVDRISGVLKRVGQGLRNLTGDLGLRLRNDLDAARKVSTTLFRMGQIGLEAGKKIFSAVTDATGRLDTMAKVASRAGLSLKTFQELNHAARRSGVSFDEYADSVKTFGINMGQLRARQGPLLGFLKSINAFNTLKALNAAKDSEQAMAIILDSMSRLKDPNDRTAFAVAAFGEVGVKMQLVAKDGASGLRALREEAHALGLVLDDEKFAISESFGDELGKLEAVADGAMLQIGASVAEAALPKLLELTQWIKDNKSEFQSFLKDVGRGIVDGVQALVDAGRWIVEHKDDLINWAKILGTVYLGSLVIPALTTTLGLLGKVGSLAMSTAGWLGRIAGFGGAAAAAGAGAGTAAAAGAGTAAGGSILGRAFGFAARFARVAGPLGALISVFDAKSLANGTLDNRKKGTFEGATSGLVRVMNAGRGASGMSREEMLAASQRLADERRRIVTDMLGITSPMTSPAGGKSTVVVEFRNPPAGMSVREVKPAAGQSVDVKQKLGARALGQGAGL